MKRYAVKEIYYTLQGEGAHTGRPAVFLRFSGCNLWSGREEDRHKAICKFCDTDFWGVDGQNGGKYTAHEVSTLVASQWPEASTADNHIKPYVVCTGGEPMLQMDEEIVEALHKKGFDVACETNGTLPVPKNIDWICMSPKANTVILIQKANELKLVFPQVGINPTDFEKMDFDHFFLQPMDNEEQEENTRQCIRYCLENPKWKLSVQMHKVIGIA